ncbi:MAG: DegT/DnrJ/EryC1/StrS family aminotransferase, partial [Cyanobacteria bacterium J06648_11]
MADGLQLMRLAARNIATSKDGTLLVKQFEAEFRSLTQTQHALTVNSGTAALHSAYFAVGVRKNTEVIVPSYTWFATAAPVLQLGATPIFCDIDPDTLTIAPDRVEALITERTRAICAVHVWGNPAAMERLAAIAQKYRIALIEDASHAHGATYQDRPVGSWGDIACFSLQGSKAVSGGELGIVVTNTAELYDRMLLLGHYGRIPQDLQTHRWDLDALSLGFKYRPHLYGVALALGSLRRLPELNRLRRRNYDLLSRELQGCEAIAPVTTYPDATR